MLSLLFYLFLLALLADGGFGVYWFVRKSFGRYSWQRIPAGVGLIGFALSACTVGFALETWSTGSSGWFAAALLLDGFEIRAIIAARQFV